MARVIWAAKALDDLEGLIRYVAADAPLTARRFAQKIVSKIDLLQAHPHAGGWIQEDRRKRYRELLQGSFRIIYRVEGDVVYIVTIHHAARLLDLEELQ